MPVDELFDLLVQHLGRDGHHALLETERDDSVYGRKQGAR